MLDQWVMWIFVFVLFWLAICKFWQTIEYPQSFDRQLSITNTISNSAVSRSVWDLIINLKIRLQRTMDD